MSTLSSTGEAMREGTAEKLDRLYRIHADAGLRLAFLLTHDHRQAEDLLQEAFVRVASRLGSLRREDRFRTYLCRTIVNLARSEWRRRAPAPDEPRFATLPDLAERDLMLSAVLALPKRQRAVIYLRYYLDLSEAEAAETLDISISALKSLNHRALVALRAQLGEVSS